jgi:hypothetical protein
MPARSGLETTGPSAQRHLLLVDLDRVPRRVRRRLHTGVLLAAQGVDLLGWMLAAAGVVGLAITYALIISATSILAVALFRYAEGVSPAAGFAPGQLERAMHGPSPLVLRVARRLDGERARNVRSKLTGTPPG